MYPVDIVIARRSYLNWKLITTKSLSLVVIYYCNREAKLLKLKANYNHDGDQYALPQYCNREAKLLKLKANYNQRP